MTAADLASIYRVSLRTIRRWAALDQWRRTTGRPVHYNIEDAAASYEHRRGTCGTLSHVD